MRWWIIFNGCRGNGFWVILRKIRVYYMSGYGTRAIACLDERLVSICSAFGCVACMVLWLLLSLLLVFCLGSDWVWLVAASCWCSGPFVVADCLCFQLLLFLLVCVGFLFVVLLCFFVFFFGLCALWSFSVL
jgi:hypothetical protein